MPVATCGDYATVQECWSAQDPHCVWCISKSRWGRKRTWIAAWRRSAAWIKRHFLFPVARLKTTAEAQTGCPFLTTFSRKWSPTELSRRKRTRYCSYNAFPPHCQLFLLSIIPCILYIFSDQTHCANTRQCEPDPCAKLHLWLHRKFC